MIPRAVLLLSALLATPVLGADGVLVVAPHPDDEVLAAAGVLYAAQQAGREVAVVVVTNGDYFGTDYGLIREGESVAAVATLGMAEERVAFLGYPDSGLLPLWNNAPDTSHVYLSARSGRQATYGTHGFGRADLHTALTGKPGDYNAPTLVSDLSSALLLFRPADVYVTGPFDDNPDHRGTYYALRVALRQLAAVDPSFQPMVHTTIVHDPVHYPYDDFWPATEPRETPFRPGNDDLWPNPSSDSGVPRRFDPTVAFVVPPSLAATILDWAAREQLLVPPAMVVTDFDTNLKIMSLKRYGTQASDVLWAHAKADEFFWPERFHLGSFPRNVARAATATASSAAPGQDAAGVIDGVVDGAPRNPGAEWAAAGPGPGAWLRLTWRTPVVIDRLVLFDRVSAADQVTAAHLVLDDGTEVATGTLANDGRGDEIVLQSPHRISTLEFVVDGAVGTPGLAELQVFGVVASETCQDGTDCDDGDPCTTDACLLGECVHDPVADGTACGDTDACNGVETCSAGACVRQPPPDCDDGDPCTRDQCASPGTCLHDAVCKPRPARGRGRCRVGIVGLPPHACEDGDPTCDQDATTDGACRFQLILCVNGGPPARGCSLRTALVGVHVLGQGDVELAELVGRLASHLPTTAQTCVGPTSVRVPLGRHGGPARRRVPLKITTADGRRLGARITLACRPAPRGVQRRPPAPPGP
jgi:LmbE family N-acetylglucosaminyl deacetylase